jgi:hypothetical protein
VDTPAARATSWMVAPRRSAGLLLLVRTAKRWRKGESAATNFVKKLYLKFDYLLI